MENSLNLRMDVMVADLSVFNTKLHHFHWFVKGTSFFVLHEKLEELYNEVNSLYDDVAERLIIIGGKPSSSLKKYLELTTLKESSSLNTSELLVELINDLKHLVIRFKELTRLAQDNFDEQTADLAIGAVSSFEKHIWMFNSFNS